MLFEAKTLKLATRVIFVFLQCYFFYCYNVSQGTI